MKKVLAIFIFALLAIGLNVLAYYGVGPKHLFGIQNIKQGLDLRGGVSIVYEADKESPTQKEMESAKALIRDRLDRKNYTEAEVATQGTNRIRIDIPGVENAEEAVNQIGKTAQLTFRDEEGNVLLNGTDVVGASKQIQSQSQGGTMQIGVSLEFNKEGKEKFAAATEKNVGKRIAICLDEDVVSAPKVNQKITDGNAIITGDFKSEDAEELAALIRAGSLPFNLKVIDLKNVGAKLGVAALKTSLLSGAIGTSLVILFMLIFYKKLGFAADIALGMYIGIVLILLSAFGITLTLPGIAGIILSVGMAVDANVIIFERMREELKAGKTMRLSIKAGFSRAFPAILDSNVTTLIAAAVLYWLGSGPIKGFAQTLSLGIIVSMFTALVITKAIVKNLEGGAK